MMYCIVVSVAVLFAFQVVGCAIPGETKARFWTEQGRIEGMINANELRHGYYHPLKAGVVDTKVVSIDDQGVITEHWFVDRGDHNVIYTLEMTPAPPTSSGYVGYNLVLKMPEEDQSYSPPSEGWMFEFDGRPWKADHRARDHRQAIVEYVLPGENVQRWTELVTTNLYFHPPHRVSVEAIMNMSKVQLEEDCPSLRWSVLKNEPDNTIYEWRHNGCQGHPPQHQIQRLAVGQLGIHSLSYVSKTPKLSDSVRKAWIHLLESAEVQGKP